VVTRTSDDTYHVSFAAPIRSITPSQFVCFYSGDVCLGGGSISTVGESYFASGKSVPLVVAEPAKAERIVHTM
jgi:hypothetical protein